MGFEGGGACQKVWLQRESQPKKMWCVKGRSPKNTSKFGSVIMQTSVPEGQKYHF